MILTALVAMAAMTTTPECAKPRANGPWVTAADYPADARRRRQTGDVEFELALSAEGCPVGCTVVTSSGVPSLDARTCELMLARARFKPKRDESGTAVPATWRHVFHWRL